MAPPQFPYTGVRFMTFMRHHFMRDEVRPFTYGIITTFFLLSSLSWGGTPEQRAASKYLNPPKH